jgi:hypothetical protein
MMPYLCIWARPLRAASARHGVQLHQNRSILRLIVTGIVRQGMRPILFVTLNLRPYRIAS